MPKKPQFLPTVTKSRTSVVTPTLNQSHRKLRFPLQLIAINTLYFPYYIQQFLSLSLFQNYLDCEFSTWSLFQVSGGHYTFQVFSLKILAYLQPFLCDRVFPIPSPPLSMGYQPLLQVMVLPLEALLTFTIVTL